LKAEVNEQTKLENAKEIAIKVLSKTLDTTKLTAEKVEMATLRRTPENKTEITILARADIEKLIEKYNREEADAEAAKKFINTYIQKRLNLKK